MGEAIKQGIDELDGFDRGDGVCKNLDERTNRCLIYATRPAICRIDGKYDPKMGTRREHYNRNIAVCRDLQEWAGIRPRRMIQFIRPPR